ncbi:MAG: DUF3179 domain-containing protein [Candidatus Moranbacteria bacterium]|nr:DUF3179 domain-containing protein [Candidatus Moranbacteria bacterium]
MHEKEKKTVSKRVNHLKLVLIVLALLLIAITYFVISSSKSSSEISSRMNNAIPHFLVKAFPRTDWSKTDPAIIRALSGGPGKDGIPAIDEPKFEPISTFSRSDSVQAIVIRDGESVKVYPYHILVWHEIVNDTVDGVSVAVTFCPLCGSAIVYNRRLPDGTSSFGVSGGLLESNMIMYDRSSETLWQQSTGKALAGRYFGQTLERIKFQLMTMGEIRVKYPNAHVLSEQTGHRRNYLSNPYSGYDTNEDFIFSPSMQDARYPAKMIFVAFIVNDRAVSAPWLELKEGGVYDTEVDGRKVTLRKQNGELSVTDMDGQEIPFYFEMWFSWAVQHQTDGTIFDPKTQEHNE